MGLSGSHTDYHRGNSAVFRSLDELYRRAQSGDRQAAQTLQTIAAGGRTSASALPALPGQNWGSGSLDWNDPSKARERSHERSYVAALLGGDTERAGELDRNAQQFERQSRRGVVQQVGRAVDPTRAGSITNTAIRYGAPIAAAAIPGLSPLAAAAITGGGRLATGGSARDAALAGLTGYAGRAALNAAGGAGGGGGGGGGGIIGQVGRAATNLLSGGGGAGGGFGVGDVLDLAEGVQGSRDVSEASRLRREAVDMARRGYAERAPAREAALAAIGAPGPEREDLSELFTNTANPFARPRVAPALPARTGTGPAPVRVARAAVPMRRRQEVY